MQLFFQNNPADMITKGLFFQKIRDKSRYTTVILLIGRRKSMDIWYVIGYNSNGAEGLFSGVLPSVSIGIFAEWTISIKGA